MSAKLALVGLGHIAEAHLDGVRALNAMSDQPLIDVTAVVDSYPGRAGQWVERHWPDTAGDRRPTVLEDWHALIEGVHKPDIVSVLLPHHLHLEVAEALLNAGIGVQMQKPIGLAIRDAKQMADLADRTGTPMVVCEPSVLGRGERLTLDWLRRGLQIGQPTFMLDQAVIDLHGGFFMTPWRHLKGMAGAGWFIDHGVHRTHWMLEAFGPCETAYAQTRQIEPVRENERWGRVAVDTEDLAAAVLRFASGVVVQWTVMSGGRGKGHRHVQIWGTDGSFHDGKVTCTGRDDQPEPPRYDASSVSKQIPDNPFAHSYQELLNRFDDPQAFVVGDPRRAIEAEAIVYACLESAHTGAAVRVADVIDGRADSYEQTVWAARDAALAMNMHALT
ncbi:MAG: Gfo/Idh/MocA family oxidoreductase [Phycisphaeraceae bacterium]